MTVESPRSSSAVRNDREFGEFGRLDLRAPSNFITARDASESGSESSASGSVPFPSGRSASRKPIEEDLPSLGTTGLGNTGLGNTGLGNTGLGNTGLGDTGLGNTGLENTGLAMKNMSRAEELTRRLHREGLPVARLWETRSAVVSLGLSPRGKPGIWLIQKIP
jgi:PPE-repeat protein